MKLKINIEGCAAVLYIIEGSRVRDNIETDSLMGVILWGFFYEKMYHDMGMRLEFNTWNFYEEVII